MDQYQRYLSEEVLCQQRWITYRALSRALEIHVNDAKSCLYDFVATQQDKKPSLITATYVVFGIPCSLGIEEKNFAAGHAKNRFSDPAPVEAMVLTSEGGLWNTLQRFERVLSVHVYSVGPACPREISPRSEPSQEMPDDSPADLLAPTGTIVNPRMSLTIDDTGLNHSTTSDSSHPTTSAPPPNFSSGRNTSFFASPGGSSVASQTSTGIQATPSAKEERARRIPEVSPRATVPANQPSQSLRMRAGIMSAFAKAKPKATALPLSDDGEDDLEPMPQPKIKNLDAGGDDQDDRFPSRAHREASLRRLMEEDDVDESDDKAVSPPDSEAGRHKSRQAVIDLAPNQPHAKTQDSAGALDERRRVRRKVTRKKQVMDSEGFLVTVKEDVWESFSEAEDEKPALAKQDKYEPRASQVKKSGKGAQENITFFFSKKN